MGGGAENRESTRGRERKRRLKVRKVFVKYGQEGDFKKIKKRRRNKKTNCGKLRWANFTRFFSNSTRLKLFFEFVEIFEFIIWLSRANIY